MRTSMFLACTAVFALTAGPAAAQRGLGVGLPSAGVRGVTDTSVGVSAPGVSANANARVDANVRTAARRSYEAKPGSEAFNVALQQDTQLSSRLQPMIGVNSAAELQAAASGFKNLGEFVAAAHLYENLGLKISAISWTDFSAAVKSSGMAKAIRQVKTDANVKAEMKTARQQARADLQASAQAGVN